MFFNTKTYLEKLNTKILLINNFVGGSGPGGEDFAKFQEGAARDHKVGFHKAMTDLPDVEDGTKRLALISGRTADNPRLLGEAIKVCRILSRVVFSLIPITIVFGKCKILMIYCLCYTLHEFLIEQSCFHQLSIHS